MKSVYVWEDVYQVYRRIGDEFIDLMASDMSIRDATQLVRAWFEENYNDRDTTFEIRRQPVDYVPAKRDDPVPPIEDFDGQDVWLCGNCHSTIFHPDHTEEDEGKKAYHKFCCRCGRMVRWDDA